MKVFLIYLQISVLFIFLSGCSVENSKDSTDIDLSSQSGYIITSDPQEGTSVDLKSLNIYYSYSYIHIYVYFYSAVSLNAGNPYIYLYDKTNSSDRDVIIFNSESSFSVYRDKNSDGSFETLVYTGTSISKINGGLSYMISMPKGVIPDLGSRSVWAYSLSSKDRLPDSGNIEFSSNISTSVTDSIEGNNPDFTELEAGYDDSSIYFEMNFNSSIASLSMGTPYIYIYDNTDTSGRYLISFSSVNNYEVRQDQNADGSFETLVYSGTTGLLLDGGKRVTITMPLTTIPSMKTKKIWAYSMTGYDCIPNTGYMIF